jgi:lipopolysaccharide transport protein LptA
MVDSAHSLRAALLALLVAIPCSHGAEIRTSLIELEAESIDFDYQNNLLRLQQVSIRQPDGTLIRANEARAKGVDVNFSNTEWEFRGAVRIEFQGGDLDAQLATASFRDNQLQAVKVTGSPARFSHQLQGAAQRSEGSAGNIEFDAKAQRIRMHSGAWYSDGRNEIRTAALIYNLADRSVQNEPGPDADSRVRLTIRPDNPAPNPVP